VVPPGAGGLIVDSAAPVKPSRPPRREPIDLHVLLRRRSREKIVILALGVVLALMFLLSMALSSTWIPIGEVISTLLGRSRAGEGIELIVRQVRLPRSITAMLAGAALGIAGLQMQTLFRNPLADPFVLGISAGASLGVAIVVLGSGLTAVNVFASGFGFGGDALITVAAIAGAGIVLAMVLALSSKMTNPATVLILGLMIGYAVQAFVTVLLAGTEAEQIQQWIAWGFGSFSGITWQRLGLFGGLIVLGLVVAGLTTKQLNALLLGENYARTMGLNVRRMRLVTMLGASVLGGVVTAFCGPIAFLGVATPHLCRGMLGTSDHRALVPATILLGATVALGAQILSLLPGSAGILPLNAVTALFGAPVVVFVLVRNRQGVFTA
jgi:iron complex transport system permease protein